MELPPYGPEPYASANSAMPAYLVFKDVSAKWDGDGFARLRAVRGGSDRSPSGHSTPPFESITSFTKSNPPRCGGLDLVDGDGFEPS